MLWDFLKSSDFTIFDCGFGATLFYKSSFHLYQISYQILIPPSYIYSPQIWHGVSMMLSCCTQMRLTIQSTEEMIFAMVKLSWRILKEKPFEVIIFDNRF